MKFDQKTKKVVPDKRRGKFICELVHT